MTDKRFTLKEYTIGDYAILDNGTEIAYASYKSAFTFCELLNELHKENQIKLEIVDAFIRGMKDEKGIAPEDKEFQCRMNHTIKVLQRLKEEMINPTEFKRLKELEK